MAINLLKNKETLQQAWKDVLDYDKSGLNWALFGYDGQTFDLKLVAKGDGGIEEMIEEFNSGKIMYAFCRVMDPKTSLPKFVLINWQGEGAPSDKKGRCANHIRDVNNFFKGAHLTITARTDDDVEPDIVIAQIVKATGSAYSFGERAGPPQDHKPIGSVYKRTIPTAEINPTERDKFWEKEEADERRRLAEEQKKKSESKKKLEEERRQRELQDAQRREEVVKERTKSISQLRASEKVGNGGGGNGGVGGEVERQKWRRQMEDDAREEADRKRRSDSSKQERTQEAQALISKRTINARAIFEQNTSAGQMSTIKHRPPPFRSLESTNGSTANNNNNGTDSLGNSSASISSPASVHSPPSMNSGSSPPSRQSSTLSPDDRTPPSPAPDSTPYSYRIPNGANSQISSTNSSTILPSSSANPPSSSSSSSPPPPAPPSYRNQSGIVKNSLLKDNLPPRQPDSEDERQDEQDDDQQDWEAAQVQDNSVTSSSLEQRSATNENSIDNPIKDQVQINEVSSAQQTTSHRAQLAYVDNCSDNLSQGADAGQEYCPESQGLTVRALYDYEAADDTEISFNPDDIITNVDQIDEGWWQGLAPDGTYGLFPANYVELLE